MFTHCNLVHKVVYSYAVCTLSSLSLIYLNITYLFLSYIKYHLVPCPDTGVRRSFPYIRNYEFTRRLSFQFSCTARSRGPSCPRISVTWKLSICDVRKDCFAIIDACRAALFAKAARLDDHVPTRCTLRLAIDVRSGMPPSPLWNRPRGRPRYSWLKPFLHSNIPIKERFDNAVRRRHSVSAQSGVFVVFLWCYSWWFSVQLISADTCLWWWGWYFICKPLFNIFYATWLTATTVSIAFNFVPNFIFLETLVHQ